MKSNATPPVSRRNGNGTSRRAQKPSLDAVIAQLEDSVRTGTVDSESGELVISQLRDSRQVSPPDGEGGRREHILRVAARVFAQKGYRATSLQEIADEVGVTRPSFYYHFRSKQEILAAILLSALERAERAVDYALAAEGTSVDKLRVFVSKYVEINTQHAEVPVLFQSAEELEPDAARRARYRRSQIDHKLANLIESGVEAGELKSRAPLISAYGMLGAINWMHTWYRPEGRYAASEVAEMLTELLLYGLANKGTPRRD